jgi:hypothetical protein
MIGRVLRLAPRAPRSASPARARSAAAASAHGGRSAERTGPACTGTGSLLRSTGVTAVRTTAVRTGAAGSPAAFAALRSRGRDRRSGRRARDSGVSERADRPARCGRSTRDVTGGAGAVSIVARSLEPGFVFVLAPAEGEPTGRGACSGTSACASAGAGAGSGAGAGAGAGAAGCVADTGTGGAEGAAVSGAERRGSSVSGST